MNKKLQEIISNLQAIFCEINSNPDICSQFHDPDAYHYLSNAIINDLRSLNCEYPPIENLMQQLKEDDLHWLEIVNCANVRRMFYECGKWNVVTIADEKTIFQSEDESETLNVLLGNEHESNKM